MNYVYRSIVKRFYLFEMARIVDFNIGSAKSQPSAKGQCSVIINNHQSNNSPAAAPPSPFPDRVTYPPPIMDVPVNAPDQGYPSVMPGVVTRNIEINSSDSGNGDSVNEVELYKLIAHTFAVILKDNNPKLIANVIDNSGKIIIEATSLCQIIALMCGVEPTAVHIKYITNEDVGCIAKTNPIKQIEDIKINYLDFKLAYNNMFNILTDQYHISLKKVIVGGY